MQNEDLSAGQDETAAGDKKGEDTVELSMAELGEIARRAGEIADMEQLCGLLAVKVVALATGVFVLPEGIRIERVNQDPGTLRDGAGLRPLPEPRWEVYRVMPDLLPEPVAAGEPSTPPRRLLGQRRTLAAAATVALLALSRIRIAAAIKQIGM